MSLEGLAFVVTGATGGLGPAVVAEILARGGRVAAPRRSAEAWQRLQARLPERHRDAVFGAPADIADPASCAAFFSAAVGHMGRLDGVAAIAGGYAGSGPLHAAPAGEWDAMLQVNLQTAYATGVAALPHLQVRGGSVVTVGSRLVEAGGGGAAAYAVSKAAVVALTRALAQENRAQGVRFNCIVPGTIDTDGNRAAMPRADRSGWTPPEAIARVVAFLLGPDSSSVNGALVPVAG